MNIEQDNVCYIIIKPTLCKFRVWCDICGGSIDVVKMKVMLVVRFHTLLTNYTFMSYLGLSDYF